VGQDFIADIQVAGHHISNTSWLWGTIASGQSRSSDPTYGTHVEVPAVIELLDLVVAGKVPAEEARACLVYIGTSISEEMDREYSRGLSFEEESGRTQTPPKKPADPETPALDNRWVYAVSSEDDPKAIKIGVARDIPKRLRVLQIGSASPIVLRWSERGGYALERHLHEKFQKRRISGEWFDFRKVANPVRKIAAEASIFLRQFQAGETDTV